MINSLTGSLKIETGTNNSTTQKGFEVRNINEFYDPKPSKLSNEERFQLIKSVGEEIIEEEELRKLVEKNPMPICYDGFEPSGRMHIAQGILRMVNVNKLTASGCIFKFWIADWFAQMNDKMGGDLEKIRIVGRYFVEIWKAVGMKLENVQFLWCCEEINKNPEKYWQTVINIARKNTVDRMTRCSQIMGRDEKGSLSAAQIMYPAMQCADIFYLKADICQLGLDQRKVNVLAREYCDTIGQKEKPIIISHHMLSGLKKDQAKMSKSDVTSAIFMEDSKEEVVSKINSAYCKEGDVKENPVLEYARYIIFNAVGKFNLDKPAKYGGGRTVYNTYEDLQKDFAEGKIPAGDLKYSVANHINELLQPVRDHFANDPYAKKVLELVRSYQVTR